MGGKAMDFVGMPKIYRYSRECVVTEKIDGTSGQIFVPEDMCGAGFKVGSRTRWITPEEDNHGFARWCYEHIDQLIAKLGPGRHFGEWWGEGIQRGYGLKEKRFSLFNVSRWRGIDVAPCYVVPVLCVGNFPPPVEDILYGLRAFGSIAAPRFMDPEGIVVYHTAGNFCLKKTLKKDEEHKGSR
jgi:hypothetical protein